jgi:hypothetical protein
METAVGQLDQLAKDLFAEETLTTTGGAAVWQAPGEIGLAAVRLDGLLRVRNHRRLVALAGPWAHASGHDEMVLEIKMPGDHLDFRMLTRAELRRQARQVQRIEAPQSCWAGEEPLWIVAPHVPEVLVERRTLTELSPGCHSVGPYPFSFLWIAANMLPLRDELIPFLIARSGQALDDFGRWVARRRPRSWLLRMVQVLPMSTSVRDEILRYVPRTDDPEIRARQRHVAQVLLELDPELQEQVNREARHAGRLQEARAALRLVLAQRGLPLSTAEDSCIEACAELSTLERWLARAIQASSAAEVLR